MEFLSRNKFYVSGAVLGAVAGFFYWYFVGCNSGGCILSGYWPNSTAYGALLGFLFVSSFNDPNSKKELL